MECPKSVHLFYWMIFQALTSDRACLFGRFHEVKEIEFKKKKKKKQAMFGSW